MQTLRTPDERFAALPDFPFSPHYVQVADGEGGSLRLHYLEEGSPRGEVILLLHGEPTWSYLYRSMIPGLAEAGWRVVVPDLPGFGRSDKPARPSDYSYQRQVDWLRGFVAALGLTAITLFGQDWGGLIGLRLVAAEPERYARVVAANHGFPTGDRPPNEAFLNWREYSQSVPELPVGQICQNACLAELSPAEVAAYDAPYPDESYKAGARIFPALVPIRPDDPASAAVRQAWQILERWEKPFLTTFSDSDPITAGADQVFQQRIPGARGLPHRTITAAGHNL